VGAVAGGFGLPQLTAGIASSIARAFLGATGITASRQEVAYAKPSTADRAEFARASDVSLASDDRPSLKDVRLSLMRRHGDEQGRAIYRQLIIDDLEAAIPALAGPTLYATARPELRQPGVLGAFLPINADVSLRAPTGRDAGEWELPASHPNAHVVTVAEADAALDRALHPGISKTGVVLDFASVAPLGRLAGVVVRAGARAVKGVRTVARAVGEVSNGATIVQDVVRLESPDAGASPPGSREGDEIVSWLATRCPVDGASRREFIRTAVVRDGVVILDDIRWPPGPPVWHPISPTNEGCS
jgi:hypothetical protein